MIKYATLFGGAMNNTETKEYKDTVKIGALLTDLGYHVKNGGYRGMMEAVSKGAHENNGKTIGYTCSSFKSTKGNEYLSKTIVSDDIYDRLRHLIEGSELFIVQRGGIGTLAELFLCLDLIRKMKDNKPKVYLVGDFWKDIFGILTEIIISDNDRKLITIVNDYNHLIEEICQK